jgi:hypothetical protein
MPGLNSVNWPVGERLPSGNQIRLFPHLSTAAPKARLENSARPESMGTTCANRLPSLKRGLPRAMPEYAPSTSETGASGRVQPPRLPSPCSSHDWCDQILSTFW